MDKFKIFLTNILNKIKQYWIYILSAVLLISFYVLYIAIFKRDILVPDVVKSENTSEYDMPEKSDIEITIDRIDVKSDDDDDEILNKIKIIFE